MNTPNIGNRLEPSWTWAADNGCYGSNYVGDEKWVEWLSKFSDQEKSNCLFAVAPDVVGDASATLARSLPWLSVIRGMGYRAAFVAQDGLSPDEVPWDEFDVLFIGGSTSWKLGQQVKVLIRMSRERGKLVHIGRVNSKGRYLAFSALGCDTADGTFLAFGPRVNLPELLGWLRHYKTQIPLFEEHA